MAEPSSRPSGPFRPTRLGQWEVIAKIAGGGMSAVYLGRRTEPAADVPNVVALKIARHEIRKDERMVEMFLAEGRLIARLVHPNIVRTLEVGGDAEHDFIAMELMMGKTFAAIHDALAMREVRLNPDIAAFAAARIADALHYAHELGGDGGRPLALVHQDVNPANVFVTFNGEVKLFDFGLAKVTAGEKRGSNIVAGKLSYLSPEQIMQMPIDRRSDIFSLGITLWELLTSRRLFLRDSDVETVRTVQLGPIPDPRQIAPDVAPELARIAKMALERNREHRYPSAAHLARDLDAYVFQRSSANELTARLAQLVDTLFPGEQKRQSGWLKPAVSPSRQMLTPSSTGIMPPAASRPPPPSMMPGEVTEVMANAPSRRLSSGERAPASSARSENTMTMAMPSSRRPEPDGPTPITERELATDPTRPAFEPVPLSSTMAGPAPRMTPPAGTPAAPRPAPSLPPPIPPSMPPPIPPSMPPPVPSAGRSVAPLSPTQPAPIPPARTSWPAPSVAPPPPQRPRPSGRPTSGAPPPIPTRKVSAEDLSRTDIQTIPPVPPTTRSVPATALRPSAAPAPAPPAPPPPPAPTMGSPRTSAAPPPLPTGRPRRPPIPLPSKVPSKAASVPPRKPTPDSDTTVEPTPPAPRPKR